MRTPVSLRKALIIACLFATPAFAGNSSHIASFQVEGLRNIPIERVLGLFPCKVGDSYSPECVATGERYLKEWKVFESIHTTVLPASDGIHITVAVQEALLVGAVDISGNYPMLSMGLQRRLTLRPGDTFTSSSAHTQTERLASVYLRSGYVGTTADYTTAYDPEQNDMNVQYTIHKGNRIKLGKLVVNGNHAVQYGRFLSIFNPYATYTVKHRRDAIHKLTDLYRKKGYLRAHVKMVEEKYDPEKSVMNVTIDVTEGSHVTIHFKGNTRFGAGKLKQACTLMRDGTYDEVALEDSSAAIQDLYNSRGYNQAQVTAAKEEVQPQQIAVTFTIVEGPHEVINHVNFLGNEKVASTKLRKQVQTKPISFFSRGALDPVMLKYDRQSLTNYYKSLGFEDVHIAAPEIIETPHDHYSVELNFNVSEGPQIKVAEVVMNGVDDVMGNKIRAELINKIDKPYNVLALASDSENVEMWLKDHGYPYATVNQHVARLSGSDAVTIRYDIHTDKPAKIGEILLVGNTLTSQRAVRDNISVKTGDSYSAKKILESEFALRRLGVFQNVHIEPMGLTEESDVIHLVIHMEESRPLVLDVSAGFATDDLYTGSISFTNFNAFGWAKRMGMRFIGGQRLSRGEITWVDPRFFNHDLQWSMNGLVQFVRLPYFSYIQPSVGTGFFRRFHRTSYLARYQVDQNYFMNGDAYRADTAGIRNSTLSKISFAVTYDTRNSFANPTKGYYLLGAMDIVNEIRGDQANFFKFRAGAGVYAGFWRIFTLLNDIRLDRIATLGTNVNVPGNERFFLGGDSTIRGFPLDSIGPKDVFGNALGANTMWVHNIELRIKVTDTFQLACWHDMGSLTDTFGQINSITFKESIGPGIRIMTPVGPIKLDWGFVLPPKQGSDPDQRFHFSFGNVF